MVVYVTYRVPVEVELETDTFSSLSPTRLSTGWVGAPLGPNAPTRSYIGANGTSAAVRDAILRVTPLLYGGR